MVNGWKTVKLGSIVDILSGGTPDTTNKEYWNGNIGWCTPSDITKQHCKYLSQTKKTITEKGLKESTATLVPVGTILLCSRATIGVMSIAKNSLTTNQGFKNLVCKSGTYNEFLYYALFPLRPQMTELAIGTTFLEVSKTALQSIEVLMPKSYEEQFAIAEVLSDMDRLISALQKLIRKKKAIKEGAMQELLTGKKRLPGFSGEWKYVQLKDVILDFIVPMRDKPKDLSGEIPWCRIEDFNGKYLSKSKSGHGVTLDTINKMNLKIFPKETLIVSCSAYLGRCAIVKSELITNQTFIGLVAKQNISIEFLFYVMCREEKNLNLLSSGTTISYLSREQFENYWIYVSDDLEEQQAVARILDDMDSEIEQLEKKLAKYQQIKEGMMQALLTGRIRLCREVSDD